MKLVPLKTVNNRLFIRSKLPANKTTCWEIHRNRRFQNRQTRTENEYLLTSVTNVNTAAGFYFYGIILIVPACCNKLSPKFNPSNVWSTFALQAYVYISGIPFCVFCNSQIYGFVVSDQKGFNNKINELSSRLCCRFLVDLATRSFLRQTISKSVSIVQCYCTSFQFYTL